MSRYSVSRKKPRPICRFCKSVCLRRESVYCSQRCQKDQQFTDWIARWKAGLETGIVQGGQTSHTIIRYLRNKQGNKCFECGWAKEHSILKKVPLELHHIDGIWNHNSENNVVLLCPNCHSLTSTYKGLNKGYGRLTRRVSSVVEPSPCKRETPVQFWHSAPIDDMTMICGVSNVSI